MFMRYMKVKGRARRWGSLNLSSETLLVAQSRQSLTAGSPHGQHEALLEPAVMAALHIAYQRDYVPSWQLA